MSTAIVTAAVVSAIAAAFVALLMWKRKKFKNKDTIIKIESALMIIVGLGLSGTVGSALHQAVVNLANFVGRTANHLWGAGVAAGGIVIAVVIIGAFAVDMWKGHKPGKLTPWLALIVPTVAVSLLPGQAGSLATSAFGAIGHWSVTAATAMLS